MGNRAVITFTKNADAPSVYLHWNGGRASVLGFLEAAEELGITPTALETHERFMDAFAEMLATRFFECEVGDTVYRFPFGETDQNNYDNGVYIIDDQLRIIDRMYAPDEEEIDTHKTVQIVNQIVRGKEDMT